MKRMRQAAEGFEDVAWFSEEDQDNINCPHGFSITCKEEGKIDKVKEILINTIFITREILVVYQLSTVHSRIWDII